MPRILLLVLGAEPLVHTRIDRSVAVPVGQSLIDYHRWRDQQDGTVLLDSSGLTIEGAEQWHRKIVVAAHLLDPAEDFRILLRHTSRAKRNRLKGSALAAHTLYDMAEKIRRYLEAYHGRSLLEEDDVIHGDQGPQVKQRLYGAPRTADFDRSTFRQIVRSFDLDPQAQSTWFVEGQTEEGFVLETATLLGLNLWRAGIDLMNLKGIGSLDSDRFRALLERLRREEVFPYVTIDEDGGGKHLRELRNYANQGLLPAGFRIWTPDFEDANFTRAELGQVATRFAADNGYPVSVTEQDIDAEVSKGKPAGKALMCIWGRGTYYGAKGEAWGRALAQWAVDHPCPDSIKDKNGKRPIQSVFDVLLTGQRSHYRFTAERYAVGPNGDLAPRAGVASTPSAQTAPRPTA